jgi:hypothetical protein
MAMAAIDKVRVIVVGDSGKFVFYVVRSDIHYLADYVFVVYVVLFYISYSIFTVLCTIEKIFSLLYVLQYHISIKNNICNISP